MTDYIIIGLLAVLVLDTDILKSLWRGLVQFSKHIKHMINRPIVKVKHWIHLRKLGVK